MLRTTTPDYKAFTNPNGPMCNIFYAGRRRHGFWPHGMLPFVNRVLKGLEGEKTPETALRPTLGNAARRRTLRVTPEPNVR